MKEKSEYKITKSDKKKYLLITKKDLEILNLCKKLKKLHLSKTDKDLVVLIMTQLEKDWRKHLVKRLNKLLNKYKK